MVKLIRHKDNYQSQNLSYLYINLAYCASYFSLSMNLLQNYYFSHCHGHFHQTSELVTDDSIQHV